MGDGTFAGTNNVPTVRHVSGIVAADLNGDGKLDLAVGAYPGSLEVLFGNGDGTFQSPVDYSTGLGNAVTDDVEVVATDLNGDGKPDLIVGGTLGGYAFNGAAVLLNDGHGNFTLSKTYGVGGWEFLFLATGDFNGDGKSDVVLVSQCPQSYLIANNCPDGTMTVLLGNGNGTAAGCCKPSISQVQCQPTASRSLRRISTETGARIWFSPAVVDRALA